MRVDAPVQQRGFEPLLSIIQSAFFPVLCSIFIIRVTYVYTACTFKLDGARVVYTSRRQLDYFTLLTPIEKRKREPVTEMETHSQRKRVREREREKERPHKFKHRTVVMKYGNLF